MSPITRSNPFPYYRRCMPPLVGVVLLAAFPLAVNLTSSAAEVPVPLGIFTDLGLTPQQIAAIDAGRPVVKVLSWGDPSEIYVFGAVHVKGSSEAYLAAARDVEQLGRRSGYRGAGELRDNATPADLSALVLEADDVEALEDCREGSCDVQLPTVAMKAFHDGVIWSQPGAAEKANALFRPMVLQVVGAYRQGGNRALGEYRDRQHPGRVGDQFETMIGRAAALPAMLPELRRYLLEYPAAGLEKADSYFYWEKVAFGLRPTIRVNHAVIYRGRAQGREFGAVAIKQLYATHYFYTALDVALCVDDGAAASPSGFYLLTLKGSQQEGLTGIKGSVLRKVVVDKTRSSLESALASIKRALEASPKR
jgi:hypothetical protein